MTKEFTLDCPQGHMTRDGKSALVVYAEFKNALGSVIAVITDENGGEYISVVSAEGISKTRKIHVHDIINRRRTDD